MKDEIKIVFITGASSGIGKACAELFASHGYNLIIAGRRKERLELLSAELKKKYNTKTLILCFDVRKLSQVKASINSLDKVWNKINVLVNNAGLAVGLSSIQDGIIEDWETMIDTNLKGLLYVTRSISPLMIKNGFGHIINISSIAGKETYANGNVYCATKHAVDSLSKAMRIDLLPHGIKVTCISPGMTETEFSLVRFKGDEERARKVYLGIQPLKPEDIADVIYYATSLPAHVNINDLIMTPIAQANATTTIKK